MENKKFPVFVFYVLIFLFVLLSFFQKDLILFLIGQGILLNPKSDFDRTFLVTNTEIILNLSLLILIVGFGYWWRKKH